MITAERLDRDALAAAQGQRLSELIATIYGRNAFYTRKLDEAGLALEGLQFPRDLERLPLTTKAELKISA
jgi:phenylacetate-coenzyme A ligase PaaK-like adenylate-forming protein